MLSYSSCYDSIARSYEVEDYYEVECTVLVSLKAFLNVFLLKWHVSQSNAHYSLDV